MPTFDPTINLALFIDDSVSPPVYWIDSETTFISPDDIYVQDGNGSIPSEADSEGVFHLDVMIKVNSGAPENPVAHQVDLGEFPFTAENDRIEVHIRDENQVQVGSGIVKSVDATHETRPWEVGSLLS